MPPRAHAPPSFRGPRPALGVLLLRRTGPAGDEGLRLDHRDVRRGPAGGLPVRHGRGPGHAGGHQQRRGVRRRQLPDVHRTGAAHLGGRDDRYQRVHVPRHGRLQVAAGLLRAACFAAHPGTDRHGPHHGRDAALPGAVGHLLRRGGSLRSLAQRLGLGPSVPERLPGCPSACP